MLSKQECETTSNAHGQDVLQYQKHLGLVRPGLRQSHHWARHLIRPALSQWLLRRSPPSSQWNVLNSWNNPYIEIAADRGKPSIRIDLIHHVGLPGRTHLQTRRYNFSESP